MQGWFVELKEVLIPLIKARNQANDQLKEDPSEYNCIVFCKAISLLNREKQYTKNRLAYKQAELVMNLMRAKPQEAWALARKLEAGGWEQFSSSDQQSTQLLQRRGQSNQQQGEFGQACKHFK
jgi:hypothetical protein